MVRSDQRGGGIGLRVRLWGLFAEQALRHTGLSRELCGARLGRGAEMHLEMAELAVYPKGPRQAGSQGTGMPGARATRMHG